MLEGLRNHFSKIQKLKMAHYNLPTYDLAEI